MGLLFCGKLGGISIFEKKQDMAQKASEKQAKKSTKKSAEKKINHSRFPTTKSRKH